MIADASTVLDAAPHPCLRCSGLRGACMDNGGVVDRPAVEGTSCLHKVFAFSTTFRSVLAPLTERAKAEFAYGPGGCINYRNMRPATPRMHSVIVQI